MSDIQEIEAQKAILNKQIRLRDQILKLSDNLEFREVFVQGFMLEEAARNVAIGGDPNLGPAERQDALAMGMAAGHVKRYLRANIQMGDRAQEELRQLSEHETELRMRGDI